MDPYIRLCSQFFSAAHSSSHFKDFQYYYFHNCIYDNLYKNAQQNELVSTEQLLHNIGPEYKLIMVGDARMANWELTVQNGAIYYWEKNDTPGIVWLKRFSDHFKRKIWLNPTPKIYWNHPTVLMISKLFPMVEFFSRRSERRRKKAGSEEIVISSIWFTQLFSVDFLPSAIVSLLLVSTERCYPVISRITI